jgi:lysophospholipase L1-like esterase
MSKLMQDFPETTFVQVTTPLVAEPSGSVAFKNWIKQLIGKPPFRLSDNVKINQLNELIRSEYAGKAPIFDLAEIESTFPDGRRQTFSQDGKEYFSLVPDYTGDMGHLNETGRKIVADKLLVFLANLVK